MSSKIDRRFYAGTKWRKLREYVLSSQPLCVHCLRDGRTSIATECDHIIRRTDRPDLELCIENVQPLCFDCHASKTKQENQTFKPVGIKNSKYKI